MFEASGASGRSGNEGQTKMLELEESAGTVLVVDDEQVIVNLLRATLEMDGYTVFEAMTGPMALGLVGIIDPSVVLLDVMMPGMDGIEVCRRLRQFHPDLPVVVLTARDDHEVERRCYEAGATRFLTKPLLPDQLAKVLADL